MAMGTLADLEDQEPIPGKESPLKIHLKVFLQITQEQDGTQRVLSALQFHKMLTSSFTKTYTQPITRKTLN